MDITARSFLITVVCFVFIFSAYSPLSPIFAVWLDFLRDHLFFLFLKLSLYSFAFFVYFYFIFNYFFLLFLSSFTLHLCNFNWSFLFLISYHIISRFFPFFVIFSACFIIVNPYLYLRFLMPILLMLFILIHYIFNIIPYYFNFSFNLLLSDHFLRTSFNIKTNFFIKEHNYSITFVQIYFIHYYSVLAVIFKFLQNSALLLFYFIYSA